MSVVFVVSIETDFKMSGLKWSSLTQSYTRCLIALLILESWQIVDAKNFAESFTWIHQDLRNGIVPTNAVKGGYDSSNNTVYVGRAFHNSDLLPASVIPDKQKAYVTYNGTAYVKHHVDYLIKNDALYNWVLAMRGNVPRNAVIGGRTTIGEPLYIGCREYKGTKMIGKIENSKKRLCLPYKGQEIYFYQYYMLVEVKHHGRI